MIHLRAPLTTDDFERYYRFRWQYLRAPWQQPPGSERDELEQGAVHLMAVDDRAGLIGVARLHSVQEDSEAYAQVRYMAVADDWRGQGVGRMLLQALEAAAVRQGIAQVRLHARESAVGFYERLGYRVVEPSHRLYDSIQHFLMRKELPHG